MGYADVAGPAVRHEVAGSGQPVVLLCAERSPGPHRIGTVPVRYDVAIRPSVVYVNGCDNLPT